MLSSDLQTHVCIAKTVQIARMSCAFSLIQIQLPRVGQWSPTGAQGLGNWEMKPGELWHSFSGLFQPISWPDSPNVCMWYLYVERQYDEAASYCADRSSQLTSPGTQSEMNIVLDFINKQSHVWHRATRNNSTDNRNINPKPCSFIGPWTPNLHRALHPKLICKSGITRS